MVEYKGIENVDPAKLSRQRALTDALWLALCQGGLRNRTAGKIESYFFAPSQSDAESLISDFADGGWSCEVEPLEAGSQRQRVKIVSTEVELTHQAFIELLEVMMIAADEHHCDFDGFQVELAAARRRWWQFW